jgi:hypothetical protein
MNFSEVELEAEEYIDEIEARADTEWFCELNERYVLIIDGTCFSRLRRARCSFCKFDRERVLVKLCWLLCDLIEDTTEEERRLSKK